MARIPTRRPELPERRSVRLRGRDHGQPGAYFVTIVTHDQAHLFGSTADGAVRLSAHGIIAHEKWLRGGSVRAEVPVPADEFVVVPNHGHGILHISEHGGARRRRAPTPEAFGQPVAGSLATLVRAYKPAVAYGINMVRGTPGKPAWQRGHYEHIVRGEPELARLRQDIQDSLLR